MKKFAIPMLIGLILTVFSFTACEQPLVADPETWYSCDLEISNTAVTVHAFYSTKESTVGKEKIEPGLTFVIEPPAVKTYAIKTYSKDAKVEADSEDGENLNITANGTTFDAIIISLKKKGTNFTSGSVPTCLTSKTYTSTENLSEVFGKDVTWKSIVKELVNSAL